MEDARERAAREFEALNEHVRRAELRADAKRPPEELLEETLRLCRVASELARGASEGAGRVRAGPAA